MSNDVLVVVQARMGSSRLPGKTMMKINDKPLIAYLIDTIQYVNKEFKIVIATSDAVENNIIRQFAEENLLDCISGSENNVASRFIKVIEQYPTYKYFIRLCGDSPLFDVNLLKIGLDYLNQDIGFDIITSKFQNSYPMGSNLEIFDSGVYSDGFLKFKTKEHFEHVTQYFYQNFEEYKIRTMPVVNIKSKDLKYKLSVDTYEDFQKVYFLLERMGFEPFRYSLKEKFFLIDEYFDDYILNNTN